MSEQSNIEFLSTGRVKLRESMSGQPTDRGTLGRQLRCFGGNWTPWLPVGVFLIRHSDGPILVDTGSSPDCIKAGYFPYMSAMVHILNQIEISPEEGIVSQLAKLGVHPEDLQAIVLTHLRRDHAGGLEEISQCEPDVPVYVSAEHWEAFGVHPWYAAMQGCTPNHWPTNFKPNLLHFNGEAIGPWVRSEPITKDAKVVAVQTPGYVPGHISVNFTDEKGDRGTKTTYLITGDAVYDLEHLKMDEPDGINSDPIKAFESLQLIKEFARQQEAVVLPNHDVNAPALLRDRTVYHPKFR